MQYRPEFEAALRVCPTCNYHDRMDAAERIALLLDDPKSFVEIDADITAADPIEFVRPSGSYVDRVGKARALTNRNEAIVCGTGLLNERKVALGVMEFVFMAGSMGSATGEKITRLEDEREGKLTIDGMSRSIFACAFFYKVNCLK